MDRFLERFPVLIFRLALVAVAAVSIGGMLVLAGTSWHTAFGWVVRIAAGLGAVVSAIWIIGSLRER